jgi:hypothetical protein
MAQNWLIVVLNRNDIIINHNEYYVGSKNAFSGIIFLQQLSMKDVVFWDMTVSYPKGQHPSQLLFTIKNCLWEHKK